MNEAYLCLGGNLGNREENLSRVKEFIQQKAGRIIAESSIYETAAWGVSEQGDYLNQVIKIATELQPEVLMEGLLAIEVLMGRERTGEQWAARTMDIDILLYNKLCIQEDRLSIPHPRLHLRNFVLVPLNEIAADAIHPFLKLSMKQLLAICPDTSVGVRKFSSSFV